MKLQLQPISFEEARAFIAQHHRHHLPPRGWKFGIAVNDGEQVVGVACVARPVSRIIQSREPYTLELTRLCTDGTRNAASFLLGAARRATFALGYKHLITYTLLEEGGVSLRAAGWKELGRAGGGTWNRPNRLRVDKAPTGQKLLWETTP
jgi:hypothetical protein